MHQSVRSILEEGSMAYTTLLESGETPNVDYAGYCCHVALNRLRQSLNDPSLSADRLEGLLRKALRKYSPEADLERREWSSVMARYLARHVSNSNAELVQ